MREPLRIFIGFDSREPIAYHVLSHSILRHASVPVSITPLNQHALRSAGIYTRERGATESTEFSITRFLVPALCNYQGSALFLDCDMLMQADPVELWAHHLINPDKAVLVCPHDYVPKSATKFLGQTQTVYPRKNHSSLMMFHNPLCAALTPDYVNTASGLELHRFLWLTDDQIGALPLEWNHLVGEYDPNPTAKNLHFTNGTPCFEAYRHCDHADLWFAERDRMLGLIEKQAAA